eukprot:scaffold69932_cov52-Attheya_sp.AAC.8
MRIDGNRKVRDILPYSDLATSEQRREDRGKEFRLSRQILFAFQVARSPARSPARSIADHERINN